jgi:hypothetical protein
MAAEFLSQTPQERLAQSRRAIVRHLRKDDRGFRAEDGAEESSEDGRAGDGSAAASRFPRMQSTWWPLLARAGRTWWRHHPAHLATDIATPVLKAYAREKPLQLVGLAAGLGAAAMLIRPWRRVSFTRMVTGVLGSAELSGAVLSVLNSNLKRETR